MYKFLLVLILWVCVGCSNIPLIEMPPESFESEFKISSTNKYLLLIKGVNSTCSAPQFSLDDLESLSKPILDTYVNHDLTSTAILAQYKNYHVFYSNSRNSTLDFLHKLSLIANDTTQLLVAFSGEGDKEGFIYNLVHLTPMGIQNGGIYLIPIGCKITSEEFINQLNIVKGIKAVIINACQSGCFANVAIKSENFKGVIICACPVGFATTTCEHTGTTAIYAGFLGLCFDNFFTTQNLSECKLSAGSWLENLRHKLSDIGGMGLPISYDPVIYATAKFPF